MLDAAISGAVELYTSAVLVAELREVLAYPKLAQRLAASGESADGCLAQYLALATLTAAATIEGVVIADPDDDHVIACALSAQADVIVSGDAHLLELKGYQRIRILQASAALALIGSSP